jgi:hypothetical protein
MVDGRIRRNQRTVEEAISERLCVNRRSIYRVQCTKAKARPKEVVQGVISRLFIPLLTSFPVVATLGNQGRICDP